jgi:hypothetical protein
MDLRRGFVWFWRAFKAGVPEVRQDCTGPSEYSDEKERRLQEKNTFSALRK